MKIFYFLFFFISFFPAVHAQNFNGQWKGGFSETSYGFTGLGGNDIDYVLELETKGSYVMGYSYTYFKEGAKRYYTICKVKGKLDRSSKEVVVTEFERVKYNTPPTFQNCFQTHRLVYMEDTADTELLRGTWVPAPNQKGNCGYGKTLLSRHIVKKLPMGIVKSKKPGDKKVIPGKEVATAKKNDSKPRNPVVANTKPQKPTQETQPAERTKNITVLTPKPEQPAIISSPVTGFKSRRKDIIKTIPITNETFKVDFYDNGEIDGDSISVLYNGKVVLSHQRLSDRPLSIKISLDNLDGENVVTMYAENLGTIPPNTALMIVTDGDKRYEVRITSDNEKSGSVVFVHDK